MNDLNDEVEFWNIVDPEPDEDIDPDEWRARMLDVADNLNCDPHDVAPDLFDPDPGWRFRRIARKLEAWAERTRPEFINYVEDAAL